MFHVLVELVSASAWTYAVVVGFVALDAFFPVVPGETVVITAAVLAGEGALSVALVLAAAFVGAVMGDNVSYLLGRTLGSRAVRKLFRGDKARRRLDWARRQLRERGRTLIVGARFIPGGRTAVTFSAGTLGMAWRRFLPTVALGCALWAVYATALGYLGGVPFSESVWKPLLVALGVAGLVAIAGEAYRRLRMNGGARLTGGAPGRRQRSIGTSACRRLTIVAGGPAGGRVPDRRSAPLRHLRSRPPHQGGHVPAPAVLSRLPRCARPSA